MTPVYFDHNATSPIDPQVLDTMMPFLRHQFGNPSSVHSLGRVAKTAIEQARRQVAELVNARPEQVIFTSGGTEANNLVIHSVISGLFRSGHLIVSAIEHESVLKTAQQVVDSECSLKTIKPNMDGLVSLQDVQDAIEMDTCLVSIMTANNETGAIQPIKEISDFLNTQGILFHTDAVAALGKIDINFIEQNVDFMSLSGHKINAPKGVGALVVKDPERLRSLTFGGGQENFHRAGTENVASIVGFGKAAELASVRLKRCPRQTEGLRDMMEAEIERLSNVKIFSRDVRRINNTSYFSCYGIDGETLLLMLDKDGFALSSGSACSSLGEDVSHVLTAMGVDSQTARSAVRVSLGFGNTEEEIQSFLSALKNQIECLSGDSLFAIG